LTATDTGDFDASTVVFVSAVFVNRELSWLDFDDRVLGLARESSIPLLERLKFVAIYSSNLDEFFQVRVGALHDREEAKVATRSFDGLTATEQLRRIRPRVVEMSRKRDETLIALLGELATNGIHLCRERDLGQTEAAMLDHYFETQLKPILTPLAVDPTHPFPYISGLALNIGVFVSDPDTGEVRFARVKVPNATPRFVKVDESTFVTIESVILSRLDRLFPGMNVSTGHLFRVTRNTDLTIDSEEAEDLLEAVEMELRRRRFGNAVRLEINDGMQPEMLDLLLQELELDPQDAYVHESLLDASSLWELHGAGRPDLKDSSWMSVTAGRLAAAEALGNDFFSVIRHRALLVHHPYEAFSTSTEEFIRQAALDPAVRAIKATLYRTSANSPIARSLIEAAERGVQVVALVELTARFDEHTNVQWAKRLEAAGAHVIYGVVGLKTHAKCLLVVREENGRLVRYAHVGTGNYNSTTAKIYEDIGLFTAGEQITEDVANLFNFLTGYSRSPEFVELVTAPTDLRSRVVRLIRNEASFGSDGFISMKMNALADPGMIDELVAAAAAGVKIRLLLRGICCLNGSSSNGDIRIRSVLGRYLEHSRIYRFGHGAPDGSPIHYIGSADMMTRNLDSRVEVLVPVRHAKHQAWLDKFLETLWSDDVCCFEQGEGAVWTRIGPAEFSFANDAQARFMAWATELQQSQGLPSDFDVADDVSGSIQRPGSYRVVEWIRDQLHRG